MSDCFLFKFPGKQFALTFELPEEESSNLQLLDIGLNGINELWNLVQPLSADLSLCCENRETHMIEYQIKPPVPHWHLKVSQLPSKIITEPGLVNACVSEVPNISAEILGSWVSQAQQQECPCPEKNKLRWEGIDIWATRARICDESPFEGRHSLWLNWSKSEFEYPLENRSNGLWVYGPIRERPTQPPLTLKLTRMGDSVNIDIFVHWSMWYGVNSPGYTALKQAICRIIDQGWELSEYTPLTDPEIL